MKFIYYFFFKIKSILFKFITMNQGNKISLFWVDKYNDEFNIKYSGEFKNSKGIKKYKRLTVP